MENTFNEIYSPKTRKSFFIWKRIDANCLWIALAALLSLCTVRY